MKKYNVKFNNKTNDELIRLLIKTDNDKFQILNNTNNIYNSNDISCHILNNKLVTLEYITNSEDETINLFYNDEKFNLYINYCEDYETGEYINSYKYTFKNPGIHKINIDFKQNLTSLDRLFYNCSNLYSIPENLFKNCPNVTTFGSIFCNCTNIVEIPEGLFDNNTLVEDFSYTFYGCSKINKLPEGLFNKCTKAWNFNGTLKHCSMQTLDLSSWDTKNIKDISWFLDENLNLESVNVSNWDSKNMTNLRRAFGTCIKLKTLDLSSWEIPNATNIDYFLTGCKSLTNLDISKFNIPENIVKDAMFNNCISLMGVKCNRTTYEWIKENKTTLKCPAIMINDCRYEIVDEPDTVVIGLL